jgi:hypothetical protein
MIGKLQRLSGVIPVVVMSFFVMAGCTGCSNKPVVDITDETSYDALESFLQNDSFEPLDKEAGTVFYADASIVLKDAMQNSPVYGEMKKQISQYVTDLVFISGDSFDTVRCNRSSQSIFTALERMASQPEIRDANILGAIENICNGNREAMIITDFEQRMNGRWMDEIPYLSEPFKKWLQKGYQIDILVEKYVEGNAPKNRFYVFFTDPTDNTAISHTMISQVRNYINDGECSLLTFNPKDYGIVRTGKQIASSSEIDITKTAFEKPACQSYVINATWDDIKELLMKIDKHGQRVEGEEPVALIDNLKMVDGSIYSIDNVQMKATNISKPFMKKAGESEIGSDETWDISDAFDVKKEGDVLKLYVNNNIFKDKHLYSEDEGFKGNLIKVEFLVADNGWSMKECDLSQLEWTSARLGTNGKKATCVSLSMDNALADANVVPCAPQNRVLYTIFIQTESK